MKHTPLAQRMRPTQIEDVLGQKHLVGENRPIRRMAELNMIRPFILTGPPGIGKTTIAEVLAKTTNLPFEKLNAVSISKKDLSTVIDKAKKEDTSYVLYVDEIHRLTVVQSEVLLPALEEGSVILIGSTTESAYHKVPPAIISRSTVFEMYPLELNDVILGLKRAIEDKENGLGNYNIRYTNEHLEFIAKVNGGDLRSSLNTLENVFITHSEGDTLELDFPLIENITNKKYFNANGDSSSYDLLSALHKSCRGSDVDAALYYGMLLLEMGELEQVVRRLSIIPSEDCFTNMSLDSHVQPILDASLRIGMPESRLLIGRVIIEICLTPKSNSVTQAVNRVYNDIKNGKVYGMPEHLRDGHYKNAPAGTKQYRFPHHFPDDTVGGWVDQDYLPKELIGTQYYQPGTVGHEKNLGRMYEYIKKIGNNRN